jgi:aryl-alcohol dehydrogenase-like predicted oxidoreductase
MEKLVAEGKVRAIGVCNFGPIDLAAAMEKHRICTDQICYNLLYRAAEFQLREQCVRRNVGILCYSPIAQGLLTGRFESADQVPDLRARSRHFSSKRPQARHSEPGCEAETFAAIERIRQICRRIELPMADVAMAWLLHQPGVLAVLAGASRPEQVRRNVAAADLSLSAQILNELDQATRDLKHRLGPNLDPWQTDSRVR